MNIAQDSKFDLGLVRKLALLGKKYGANQVTLVPPKLNTACKLILEDTIEETKKVLQLGF